ncbi:MAG: adenine-specific methyltransferase EcoRI family protein [Acidithiobacillus sp.]|uniref:adenine-specific methyltransferase EcoRI family protein n=1 Tax=Acidithiobacillus ferrooxidans TaxID=920 RepID=UPI000AD31D5F|nr:adenine-specific methyltransferase EcoRI family protein [Acidithiobacillus ferrooxidans]
MTKAARRKPQAIDTRAASRNRTLQDARRARQDEFYTQYIDIQKEVEAYLEFNPDTFRDKIVYCNCDDPFESNFFLYFAANFNQLGLKKLITTSYDGSPIASAQLQLIEYTEGNSKRQEPKAIAVILDHVKDEDGDGAANIDDVKLFLMRNKAARKALKDDGEYSGGDFRSAECVTLLKEADIVVTNPPFSLFREYVAQLVEHEKKFVIIGPKNATTYKEIFPLIKETKLWLGSGFANGNAYFSIPAHCGRTFADGVYDESTGLVKFRNVGWFTNLDHGRRHQKLPLMTMAENLKFSKHKEIKGKPAYDRYDNYDAIEVPFTDAIPNDYDGAMGVPITFLDKYNPEQFEILGITDRDNNSGLKTKEYTLTNTPNAGDLNRRGAIRVGSALKSTFARILIRHRSQSAKGKKK